MVDKEMMQTEEEIEINLGELFQLLKQNIKMIVISILIGIIVLGIMTVFFIDKKYESTSKLFLKPDVTEGITDYTQINSNNLMVNNYIEMLKGNNIQSQAADELSMETSEVKAALTISNQTNTQIISITAITTDPELSKQIVDAVVKVFRKEVKETLNVNNIAVVDQAEVATAPVSPNLKMNLIIGALLGGFISVGYLFIKFMFSP